MHIVKQQTDNINRQTEKW